MEVWRLLDTCPRRTYSQWDNALARQMSTIGDLTMALYADLRPCVLLIRLLEGLEEVARGGVWHLLGVPRPADAHGEHAVPDRFLDLLDRMRRRVARAARSTWEGFAAACREDLGIEPETALGASEQGRHLLDRLAEHRGCWRAWRRFAVGEGDC